MSLPSKKHRKQLLKVKQQLMEEIASYIKDGVFNMSMPTVVYMKIQFGNCFRAEFDLIKGNKDIIRIYSKERDFIPLISFVSDNDVVVEDEIGTLMSILDYVEVDSRKK